MATAAGSRQAARSRKRRPSPGERQQEKTAGSYDYTLLFLTVFLACFGLVMIYSSSSYIAETTKGSASYFLKRQGIAVVLGTIVMLFVSTVDYRVFLKPLAKNGLNLTWLLYLFALLLQVYTLFFGVDLNGAKRWIKLGPLGTIQPSELTKVAVILMVANLIYKTPKMLEKMRGFVLIIIYIMPAIALIGKENMSTALVIMGITFVMCFVASRKKAYFFVSGGVAAAAVMIIINFGWRSKRVEIWKNVETNADAFQIRQGLYAIASGGLFGTGLGQSMQKLGFIPEAYNDMIFTVICEELGLIGAAAVILLFFLLILRIFRIAMNTTDLFGALICTGVMTHIAIQVIMNVLVVTNTIPSTGIPLPLISYGGSSVIFLLAEIGIVLNISRNIGRSQMAVIDREYAGNQS
jgi:cell division protein FtsW